MRAFILVKPLDDAKMRLSNMMDPPARRALVEAMLTDLLIQARASRSLTSVTVVTADPTVARIAASHGGAALFEGSPRGMNPAAALAAGEARAGNCGGFMVLPADLPWVQAGDIDRLAAAWRPGGVAGVPAADGGTNALVLDTRLNWRFAFGRSSFEAHQAVAASLGLSLNPFACRRFSLDIDGPSDVRKARALPNGSRTAAALGSLLRPLSTRNFS